MLDVAVEVDLLLLGLPTLIAVRALARTRLLPPWTRRLLWAAFTVHVVALTLLLIGPGASLVDAFTHAVLDLKYGPSPSHEYR